MRRFLVTGMLLLLPLLAFSIPSQAAQSSGKGCIAQAQAIALSLQRGTFNAARIANFSPDMKRALAAQMNQFWSLLDEHFGGFVAVGVPTRIRQNDQSNIILPLRFTHGSENLHVTCNADGDAIGLFMTPGLNEPQK